MSSLRARFAVTYLIREKGFWSTYQTLNQLVSVVHQNICATYASVSTKFVWDVLNQGRQSYWTSGVVDGSQRLHITGIWQTSKKEVAKGKCLVSPTSYVGTHRPVIQSKRALCCCGLHRCNPPNKEVILFYRARFIE